MIFAERRQSTAQFIAKMYSSAGSKQSRRENTPAACTGNYPHKLFKGCFEFPDCFRSVALKTRREPIRVASTEI